jgi:transcriptional regulator with PAS, ATPase and Fis domain
VPAGPIAATPRMRYVATCNIVKRFMGKSTCLVPFEKGPKLCSICRLVPEAPGLRRCSRLVAESAPMRALMLRAAPIAASDAPVIIRGESGTGKEVLARALHANSPRRDKPFLAVNVAALPAELLESELFGHVKGAFTGAGAPKRGLFEAAEGGTLLLDEIAEMPFALQAKLLRALQDGEIRRVGDTRPFSVDVRIFCATNQDLRACVAERRFREDLYYRLRVFTLAIPPMRERKEDLLPLAQMFLEQEGHATGRFTARAHTVLETYRWPGNVRELANSVKHGAVLAGDGDIDTPHLPEEVTSPQTVMLSSTLLRTLADMEREHVMRVLEACGGRQLDAARVLDISRTTLWRKLKAFGIEVEE